MPPLITPAFPPLSQRQLPMMHTHSRRKLALPVCGCGGGVWCRGMPGYQPAGTPTRRRPLNRETAPQSARLRGCQPLPAVGLPKAGMPLCGGGPKRHQPGQTSLNTYQRHPSTRMIPTFRPRLPTPPNPFVPNHDNHPSLRLPVHGPPRRDRRADAPEPPRLAVCTPHPPVTPTGTPGPTPPTGDLHQTRTTPANRKRPTTPNRAVPGHAHDQRVHTPGPNRESRPRLRQTTCAVPAPSLR